MIATNDLRINNRVHVLIANNFRNTKVIRLGRVKALSTIIIIEYLDNKDPPISEESKKTIEPVMLTRDWLKRAHFQSVEETERLERMQFDGFEVSFYKKNGSVTAMANKITLRKLYHLHTLQNLYHALKGEELWV